MSGDVHVDLCKVHFVHANSSRSICELAVILTRASLCFCDKPGMKESADTRDLAWSLYKHAEENGYRSDDVYFKAPREPPFPWHMLDLPEDPDMENIEICKKCLARKHTLNLILEMEIRITGGVEHSVDNSRSSKDKTSSPSLGGQPRYRISV